ncbi:MAG: hypothetical protein JWP74_1721 [Marmoricola sp.]|nr:hypothetical protein [Marmoricola sp.]
MNAREAVEALIRDSMEAGYRSAEMGVPMADAQRLFLADPLAPLGIQRLIDHVRSTDVTQ